MARILIGNIKGPKGDTGPQGLQGNVGPVGPQGPLPPLVNNGTTTETGFALDARYGKTLKDQLDTQNSNLTNIGTYQIYAGNYTIIPVGSKEWMCNWFSLTPGTYLIGFTSQYTLGVDTFLKVTDSDPTKDTALYELLRLNSGSASKVINITNSKIVLVLINNNSSTNYTVYPDPGAFFVWTLRVK